MDQVEANYPLNQTARRIWNALKMLSQKFVHDSNNIYGALQGYISLMEMANPQDEQFVKYISAMQEALDAGMLRNKALASFYREDQVMVISVEPVGHARQTAAALTEDHDMGLTVSAPTELPALPLEEPAYAKLITLLAYLAEETATIEPVLSLAETELNSSEIEKMVMDSAAGRYLNLALTINTAGMNGDLTSFLQPFKMSANPDRDLGVAGLLPILANHHGNLNLELTDNGLLLNFYFPYPA